MTRIKKLLSVSLIGVLSGLLLFTLFQVTSVSLSSETLTCNIFGWFYGEACEGAAQFECEVYEYRSLCKLVCNDGGGHKFLMCDPIR